MKDPTAVAAKWKNNLSAATDSITSGIDGVTVAPGQAAARQKAVYVANVSASADKWATNVAAVPLESWKDAFKTKGIPRIATGAAQAEGKMVSFMQKALPFIATAVAGLPARGNLEQNISRSAAFQRKMATFKA